MLFDIVKIIRSKRKTISIEVNNNGIVVRAPFSVAEEEIKILLDKKKNWVEKHLKIVQERQNELNNIKPYTKEEIADLATKAREIIPDKVKHYSKLIGVDFRRITIRCQRTRWGSCSAKGNLSFNCLLMEFPYEIIDSIVVHELCHRKHMNHSANFYEEIERVYPKYKQYNKWLKENGGLVLSRLG